ncbi:MAG: hypothetical protein WD646_09880 [Actinomycetota bacterium]
MDEKRTRAYRAGAQIARERLANEAPLDAEAVRTVQASDIVVVDGTYDHIHLVLDALEMPHTRVQASQVESIVLRLEQLVVINCPGNVSPGAIVQIRDFVADGGSLFTTDWALRNVIEPAFQNTVAYNDRPTSDDVVRIEIAEPDNPFLQGVIDPGEEPLWWLEGSSYPIRVLNAERVKVLVRSKELEGKYGEAPVAVLFSYGHGEVFHMISHYYLQRTELRDQRHKESAMDYACAKGVAVTDVDMDDLSAGDVESAASSARFLTNIVANKKRRQS